jgi:hypothetical protein
VRTEASAWILAVDVAVCDDTADPSRGMILHAAVPVGVVPVGLVPVGLAPVPGGKIIPVCSCH